MQPFLKNIKKQLGSSYGYFQISTPGHPTRRYTIPNKQITIGRVEGNDLVLAHDSVSREHARVWVSGGDVFIEDLESKNGTFIKAKRLPTKQPILLKPRATIVLGSVRLRYRRGISGKKAAAILGGGGLLGIAALCVIVFAIAGVIRNRDKAKLGVCDQPSMAVRQLGGLSFTTALQPSELPTSLPTSAADTPEATVEDGTIPTLPATVPPSRPITSLAFMELPFPYDGGNENFGGTLAQFRQANQRSAMGGRINSFFDHFFPLYPASNDPSIPGGQEPAEEPAGKNILLFDGFLSGVDNYSGHPALDYSTFVRRQPTTPVFAAADGVISSVGEHTSSGALFVRIVHTVPGAGNFQTTYWHLHPDEHFDAMLGREGEPITAGTRVGTMGNTGWSTGHHLHFEVRFDRNNDGFYSGGEVVDPYGYIPSVDYPEDPWFDRTALSSAYLWIHPLGIVAEIPAEGGGQADTGGIGGIGTEEGEQEISVCAPPGSLPSGGTVHLSWTPDPLPTPNRAGVGLACTLSILDAEGSPISQFDPPLEITIPFNASDLSGIDPDSLAIYWQESGEADWTPLPTTLDFETGVAVAETDRPGRCGLMGDPLGDLTAPVTKIEASGNTAPGGAWYDRVTVTLESEDESGVALIEYSLDAGTTWQTYTGPFELKPGEIPPPAGPMDEEFFGGRPGAFLILASATDTAGNVEDPPAFLQVVIDPSQNPEDVLQPQAATATQTQTPTLTPTIIPTFTPTPTPTPTTFVCEPTLVVVQNAFCRVGPGTVYDIVTAFTANTSLNIDGQNVNDAIKWWWVQIPDTTSHCWISDSVVETSETASCVDRLPDPPTPTPTLRPSPTGQFFFTLTPKP